MAPPDAEEGRRVALPPLERLAIEEGHEDEHVIVEGAQCLQGREPNRRVLVGRHPKDCRTGGAIGALRESGDDLHLPVRADAIEGAHEATGYRRAGELPRRAERHPRLIYIARPKVSSQ